MNTYSEYDVDDDLPVNTSNNTTTTATAPVTNIARISKRGKELKEEETGKSTRKPRPKLDFNRLLKGSRGLGYLAVCTKKNLKLSGKPGSEANDLSQICIYLQEWAKQVFPKVSLMDFLLKVEEICQSRLMKACVPQILARLKEMGEDVDLKDLETVEGEIMAKMATTAAEMAMENISAGLETTTQPISTELDFNIDELLIRNRNERVERSEKTEHTDNESGNESEDDEEEFAEEMNDFINDESDESERENNSGSEEEAEFSDSEIKPSKQVKREISFNFEDDEQDSKEGEIEQESEDEVQQEQENQTQSTIVNDDEAGAPVKKRNIAVIMDSDSD